VVPLNILLKAPEIAYHLEDSDARAYLCFEGSADLPMGKEGFDAFGRVSPCEHFFLMTANPAAPRRSPTARPWCN
jgi:long-chain acyl-CoA synthetase